MRIGSPFALEGPRVLTQSSPLAVNVPLLIEPSLWPENSEDRKTRINISSGVSDQSCHVCTPAHCGYNFSSL